MGKDAATGFINLLRRFIPPGELLKVCFEEWKKPCGRISRHPAPGLAEAQARFEADEAQPPSRRDPVATYHAIRGALQTPKPRGSAPFHGRPPTEHTL